MIIKRLTLILYFSIFVAIHSYAQYYPFYPEQRKIDLFSFSDEYFQIIDNYNQSKDLSKTIDQLDSLRQTALKEEDFKGYLYLSNEHSNFLKFSKNSEAGFRTLKEAMELYKSREDTLTIEYIVSLRLLRTLVYSEETEKMKKQLLDQQLELTEKLNIGGEPLVNLLVDYGLYLINFEDKESGIDMLYRARKAAFKNNDLKSLAVADYSILASINRKDLLQTKLDVITNDIEILEQAGNSLPILVYTAYFNYLAGERYYHDLKNQDLAVKYYKKSLNIIDSIDYPLWNLYASVNSMLSLYHAEKNNYSEFQSYYTKAVEAARNKPMSPVNQSLAFSIVAESMMYFNPDSSMLLIDELENQKGFHYYADNSFYLKIKTLNKLQRQREGLKLIANIRDSKSKSETYANLHFDSLPIETKIKINELEFDFKKNMIKEMGKTSYLTDAINLIESQNNLWIEFIENSLFSNEISNLTDDYHDFVMDALIFLHEQNLDKKYRDLTALLVFSSKSLQLNNIIEKNNLSALHHNSTLLDQQIVDNSKQIQSVRNELAIQTGNETNRDKNQKKLNTLLIENLILKNKKKFSNEKSANLLTIPAIDDIQKKLSKEEAIIEYCINDTTIIRTLITKDDFSTYTKHLNSITSLINESIFAIKTGSAINNDISRVLLSGIADELSGIRRIIVIPDGNLLQIPFELLRLGDNLLLDKYSIVYNYSTTLWYRQKSNPVKDSQKTMLAAAPIFETVPSTEGSDLAFTTREQSRYRPKPLEYSKQEINAIKNHFERYNYNVNILQGKESTERNLRESLAGNKIIHIATHGIVDMSNSEKSSLILHPDTTTVRKSLSENDNMLMLGEIYMLNIDAELVTLSACKTGIGEITHGEGVLSFPRGFIIAGVPNILASMWNVSDSKTTELMISFYDYLLQGFSYSKSLQMAKKDCQKKGFLPIDWAGFILIGV